MFVTHNCSHSCKWLNVYYPDKTLRHANGEEEKDEGEDEEEDCIVSNAHEELWCERKRGL